MVGDQDSTQGNLLADPTARCISEEGTGTRRRPLPTGQHDRAIASSGCAVVSPAWFHQLAKKTST